jgi:hypothetical protein
MHWELYVIKIKIALVGNACSGPLSIIRSRDLLASDIRREATLEGLWVKSFQEDGIQ